MHSFETHQDTGIDWIGKIPNSWSLTRGRFLFTSKKEINRELRCQNLLSLTLFGVLNKDIDSNDGLRPEDYGSYQIFQKDDLVFKLIDLENVKTSRVGLVHEEGIMSPVYIRHSPNANKINPKFSFWFYYDLYKKEIFNSIGSGVRSSLSSSDLLEIELPVPPLQEQQLISRYLDKKTEQIDGLIEKIQKKIEFLKEQRTSLINQCVTKGLDPNVEMKDSGIEWIGEIPEHWRIKKLKHLVSFNTDTLSDNTDPEYEFHYIEIGDVDYIEGVSIHEKITFDGSPSRARRVVRPKDVVVSTVRTYLRAIGVIPDIEDVVCSTGFCVLREKTGWIEQEFLSYSVRSEWFISEVISNSYGVSYPAINSSELVEIKVVIPPLDEQRSISRYLEKNIKRLDREILFEEKRISLLKEYRQSLISSVVTGKVRVTEDMI